MDLKDDIIANIRILENYCWLPKRAEQQLGLSTKSFKEDEFGMELRYNLIKNKLLMLGVKDVVDLGGNCGYFSFQMLDENIVRKAWVYDNDIDVLNFGNKVANYLGLQDHISFIEKSLSLNNINELPEVDLVLCLNLIHHAGVSFDVDIVEKMGWSKYATDFLKILRKKYRIAIIGVGFKKFRPIKWSVPRRLKPIYFSKIANQAGWKVVYDANIEDLSFIGERLANGRKTKKTPYIFILETIYRFVGYRAANIISKIFEKLFSTKHGKNKLVNYHIYILQ